LRWKGGNILFHTPNVDFNCIDFLARAGLVVRQDRKTWAFCLLGGPGAHHSDQSNTYRCYEYRVLHILPFLLASTIILNLIMLPNAAHFLARVGIEALVDEATGYRYVRERMALARILEKFIAQELHPWTKKVKQ
jgi:hypothetical protein